MAATVPEPKILLVAIIGGGISGLSLAISLSQRGISSNIYENRDPSHHTAGALMLSPNSLRILDHIGVYDNLKQKGFEFDAVVYQDSSHSTIDQYNFGNKQKFGYQGLRVYREALLQALRNKAAECDNIQTLYGKKFVKIVEENSEQVTFQFADGETASSKILIGADGVHSTVRRAAIENISAKFTGLLGVTGAAQTNKIAWPETDQPHDPRVPYPLPAQIYEPNGTFVLAPNNPDGSELLAGMQVPFPDQDRAGWDALVNDKDQLQALFKRNYDTWSPFIRSAIDSIPKSSMFIWPYCAMPRLTKWTSHGRRVIIIGDAAHAIPPTAGQGASQAFEDAFSMAVLIEKAVAEANKEPSAERHLDILAEYVENWQVYRQERVDKVLALANELNERRKPGWVPDGTKTTDIDLRWLYNVDVEGDMVKELLI